MLPAREKYAIFVQRNIFYCIASKQLLYKGCVEIRGDGTSSPSARAEQNLTTVKTAPDRALRQEFRARG
jgi:hypothetical protein